jgi:hypothetical protein
MRSPTAPVLASELAAAVDAYQRRPDVAALLARLEALAAGGDADALAAAAAPYHDMPEVVGPIYERIVAERPADARALVVLANAYWLAGRGPEVVGGLASRALAADPSHRGAWHLWALAEPDPRARTGRWQQVATRFPEDELARALLADCAAGLAGAEGDREALALAIETYAELRERATRPEQRTALDQALTTLRRWRL